MVIYNLTLIVIPVDPDLSGEEPESIIELFLWIPCQARNDITLDRAI